MTIKKNTGFNRNRTFGIEIEGLSPVGRERLAQILQHAGVQCRYEGYNHRTQNHWKIVTDASIIEQNGEYGFELVSPPLRGAHGLEEIKKVCKALNEAGCKVNRSCGLHVHHDASDLDVRRLKGLVRLYQRSEAVLDTLHPKSRQNNPYCRTTLSIDLEWGRDEAGPEEFARMIDNAHGRYLKLNLAAYRRHGTVEFRQHAGTTNATKIWHWVVLTQAMVEKAAGGRLSLTAGILPNWERVKQAIGLTTYWGGSETEQAAAKYYSGRRKALQAASV